MKEYNKRYPKRIYATVPAELYDRIQEYGIHDIDVLITELLANYFEKLDGGSKNGNRK